VGSVDNPPRIRQFQINEDKTSALLAAGPRGHRGSQQQSKPSREEIDRMSTRFSPVLIEPFSPSELVLLSGDQFAASARFGNNVQLLHTDAKVSAEDLGQAMLGAAFLASEQSGAIHLEVRQKKALMGLRKVSAVFADPNNVAIAWPAHSLEANILRLAQELQAGESNDVCNIVYLWLGKDSSVPWRTAVELIQRGLVARGHVEEYKKTRLKVFSASEYTLPESTAALATRQPVAQLWDMLQVCERDRPELWKLLQKQIKDAVKKRTEDSDTSF
jgi:hypothetical protein